MWEMQNGVVDSCLKLVFKIHVEEGFSFFLDRFVYIAQSTTSEIYVH